MRGKNITQKKILGLPIVLAISLGVLLIGGGGLVLAQIGGVFKPQAAGDIALQRGLIGWWKMDGNTKDSTPYGDDGTLSGSPPPSLTTDRKGKANSAYAMTGGSGQGIILPSTAPYNTLGTGNFTIGSWIKTSDTLTQRTIFSTAGSSQGFRFGHWNGLPYYLVGSGSYSEGPIGSTTLNDNTWHYLAIVYSYSSNWTVTAYIDGVQTGSIALSASIGSVSNAFSFLGSVNSANGGVFSGSFDDVKIWKRSLSASEIAALYKSYNPGLSADSGEKGMVGWWKMDGDAKDGSPYANDATVYSATLTNDRKAKASSAYSFNGSTSCLNRAAGTTLAITGPVSVEAWVYPTGTSTIQTVARAGLTADADYHLFVDGTAKKITFSWYDGTFGNVSSSNNSINLNAWSHIAVTRDVSNNILLYVNGVQVGSGVGTTPTVSASSFSIGATICGTNQQFTGSIDDVRVYNRQLLASEVAQQAKDYDSSIKISNLQKGLVGDWSLNGSAMDATPYGSNGTVTGATLTTDRKARANSAYSFSGGGARIVMGQPSNLQITSSMTISTWVNTSQVTQGGIVSKWYNTATNRSYRLLMNVGNFEFDLSPNGSSSSVCGTSASINSGTWVHVMAVYDAAAQTVKLYKNGVLVTTCTAGGQSVPASVFNNAQDFEVGTSDTGTAPGSFVGAIDDVRIWNRPLTTAEVGMLYAGYR